MSDTEQTPLIGNLGQPGPRIQPENGLWRRRSTRVGIGAIKYVWWNWFYAVMEFFNRFLSRDPNRKVSWDRWPTSLGLLYLIAKIRFNRSNALTDPYDYKSTDNDPAGDAVPSPNSSASIAPDGKWVSDDRSGQMGASMTRFSSNIAPRYVRPDVEAISPSAREVSKNLRRRKTDAGGEEIMIPALILNVIAQGWIQFQFHGFGGNTLHDPINQNPYRLPRDPKENWPDNEATINRTAIDPTRLAYDGRPTPINEKVHAWVQGQLYGNNHAEMSRLRSFQDGKLALGPDGLLLEDPSRPGVDLTGFMGNYNPFLSILYWLFTREHNAIADYLKQFDSSLGDEELFQLARKTNCAHIARIHTVEWTEDLLQHPTLQKAMHLDWYGMLGPRLKCRLMRLCHAKPTLAKLLKPFTDNDIIWGMPGSKWDHFDGPFQVPKHFRMVYRLHELIPGKNEIFDPQTGRRIAQIDLLDFVHENTRKHVHQFGYGTLGWSFLSQSCGALTLHNFPGALTQYKRMLDGALIDLAELDILREREVGTGSYNEFRRSLGEPPVESFLELTGGNAELAKEIERVYHGELNKVDAGIGILAEPKPAGFALGFVQFYQFVLNAPRRVKSNRFLSEGYNYNEYRQGLNWVEHAGGFLGVIRRHLPALEEKLEGIKRGFAPWPDPEDFPQRLLNEAGSDIGGAFLADLRTWAIGAVAAGISVWCVALPRWFMSIFIPSVFAFLAVIVSMAIVRLFARRFMQNCEKKCNTDKRGSMFGTLYHAERTTRRAAFAGSISVGVAMILCITGACVAWPRSHWLSLLYLLTAVSGISTLNWAHAFTLKLDVLKVALRNRMRRGQAATQSNADLDVSQKKELDRLLYTYAPGRQFFTAYDLARMRESEKSNLLSEIPGIRWRKLLINYADLVVEEDRKLVPALSRNACTRLLQGLAQTDLRREMAEGDLDPSP